MAEQRDYTGLLPLEPPEGSLEYVLQHGGLQREYMVYRADWWTDPLSGEKEKMVRAVCTKCGESSLFDYLASDGCGRAYAPAPFGFMNPLYHEPVMSGGNTQCPFCGAEVEAKHIGNVGKGIEQHEWVMQVARIEDRVALIGWCFRREIDKAGKSLYYCSPCEAYVVEQRKMVRLAAYYKFMSSIVFCGQWEQRKAYRDVWGYTTMILPWDKEILVGSTAENSKLDLFLASAVEEESLPVTYMKLWQKYRNVENLVVQGAAPLVHDMLKRAVSSYGYNGIRTSTEITSVDWKEKKPARMLGLNKDEFSACVRQKWTKEELECFKDLRSAGIAAEQIADLRRYHLYSVCALAKADRGGVSVMRCLRYLEKQNNHGRATDCLDPDWVVDISYLMDYWQMAAQIGLDLSDISLRLPKDLRRAHDLANERLMEMRARRAAAEREKELAKRRPAFAKRAEELALYGWEQGGLLIRCAKDEEELIREGKVLSHCVARYAEDVATGKTAIFFIRKAEEPDTPFYTLELDEEKLTVRQNRGKKNCDRTEAVQKFEAAWLVWLQEQRQAGALTPKTNKKKKESAA